MSYSPNLPPGQAAAAASEPVVIASDQTAVPVDGSAHTQPVSAASLPLPAGAATAAKQPALGVAGTPSADVVSVQGEAGMTALKVDGSAVTQPVSASALPLPAGAATSAAQTTGNTSVASIDTKTPALGQALAAASVPVVLPAATVTTLTPPAAITGFATSAKQPALGAAATAASTPVNIASDQTVPVSAASLPLPSGAATSAAQSTGNTSVASIDTKTPALGQALAAAAVPVVLTAIQQTALTPPAAITGFALDATQTNGTQKTQVVDGSGNVAGVLKNDGTAASENAQLVAGAYLEKAGLSVASVTSNDLVASFDASGYESGSIQLSGTWTGTVQVQGSNDNAAFTSLPTYSLSPGTASTNMTGNGLYTFPIKFRYLRIRVTTGSTGTVTGVAEFFTLSSPLAGMQVNLVGTNQVSLTAATSGGYSVGTMTTATTTTHKSGGGTVHVLNILGGTLGTVAVYDNTAASGTAICPTFTPTAPISIVLDVGFATGLTIITGSATVLSVSYK